MDYLMDINEICQLLPHRYPFLLVDRVVEFEADKRIVAIKNVTINEPQFNGHFPGNPVFPGVMIVEALAQALRSCLGLCLTQPVVFRSLLLHTIWP